MQWTSGGKAVSGPQSASGAAVLLLLTFVVILSVTVLVAAAETYSFSNEEAKYGIQPTAYCSGANALISTLPVDFHALDSDANVAHHQLYPPSPPVASFEISSCTFSSRLLP